MRKKPLFITTQPIYNAQETTTIQIAASETTSDVALTTTVEEQPTTIPSVVNPAVESSTMIDSNTESTSEGQTVNLFQTGPTPPWWHAPTDENGDVVGIQPRMLPMPREAIPRVADPNEITLRVATPRETVLREAMPRTNTIPFGVLQNTDGSSARRRCRCVEKKRRKVLMEIRYIPLNDSILLPGEEGKKFFCKCSHLRKLVSPNDVNRFN